MRIALLLAAVLGFGSSVRAAEVELIPLPSLKVAGQAARAHTQGMERCDGWFYVTARLESARPKRAILARTTPAAGEWETWDVTPSASTEASVPLDHPGGFQSDGRRLWIPVAQSLRRGRTIIRVFDLDRLKPGQPAVAALEIPVADHVGALAVAKNRNLVLGASWDTETIYAWDLEGRLQRTLSGAELQRRSLGVVTGPDGHSGVAVQDWKFRDDRLYASGLFGESGGKTARPRSRLLAFTEFLGPQCQHETVPLPEVPGVELAQEAMDLAGGWIYFLPENLGATNRCFRIQIIRR